MANPFHGAEFLRLRHDCRMRRIAKFSSLMEKARRTPQEEIEECVQTHGFASICSPQNSSAGRPSGAAPVRTQTVRPRVRGGTIRGYLPGIQRLLGG